ncbi:hypothetical protein BC830DRAFT_1163097 [Chytriomyces sp. MP71]|nr:hypothetical protein BC830DRAFT_1163097 [Chytriomyces sp. MP71]
MGQLVLVNQLTNFGRSVISFATTPVAIEGDAEGLFGEGDAIQSKYVVLDDSASQSENLSREPKALRTDHDSLLHEVGEMDEIYAELETRHASVSLADLSTRYDRLQSEFAHVGKTYEMALAVHDRGVLTASHAALQDKYDRVVKDLESLQQTHSSLVREHNVLLTNSSSLEQQVKSRQDRTQDVDAIRRKKPH